MNYFKKSYLKFFFFYEPLPVRLFIIGVGNPSTFECPANPRLLLKLDIELAIPDIALVIGFPVLEIELLRECRRLSEPSGLGSGYLNNKKLLYKF